MIEQPTDLTCKETYFTGFEWPVPVAFSDALAACRFEKGDILYSDICAYTMPWGEALKSLKYSLQVNYPPRSYSSTSNEDKEGIFRTNWNSTVKFELTDYTGSKPSSRIFNVTQGELYSLLWKGNFNVFSDEGKIKTIPDTVQDIHKILDTLKFPEANGQCFIMAYDRSSSILREKKRKIEELFCDNSSPISISNQTLQEQIEKPMLPTIEVLIFKIPDTLKDAEKELKSILYTPTKNRKTDREFFRLKSHGLLKSI